MILGGRELKDRRRLVELGQAQVIRLLKELLRACEESICEVQ